MLISQQQLEQLAALLDCKPVFERAVAEYLRDVFPTATVICSFETNSVSYKDFIITVEFQLGGASGVETPTTALTGDNEEAGFSGTLILTTGTARGLTLSPSQYQRRIATIRAAMTRGLLTRSEAWQSLIAPKYTLAGGFKFNGQSDSTVDNFDVAELQYEFSFAFASSQVWNL